MTTTRRRSPSGRYSTISWTTAVRSSTWRTKGFTRARTCPSACAQTRTINAEPADEADRGRHPGFARHEGLAGGPGSLAVALCYRGRFNVGSEQHLLLLIEERN